MGYFYDSPLFWGYSSGDRYFCHRCTRFQFHSSEIEKLIGRRMLLYKNVFEIVELRKNIKTNVDKVPSNNERVLFLRLLKIYNKDRKHCLREREKEC
jgi:hypothetical protein